MQVRYAIQADLIVNRKVNVRFCDLVPLLATRKIMPGTNQKDNFRRKPDSRHMPEIKNQAPARKITSGTSQKKKLDQRTPYV